MLTPRTQIRIGHLSQPGPRGISRKGVASLGRLVWRWPALAVFCAVAVVYVATGTYGANQSRDTVSAAVAAWALGARHTLDLDFLSMATLHSSILWIVRGAHGALVSNRFPGAVLLAAPLYAIVGGWYSPVPATITAALATAGACAVLYKVLARLESRGTALAGAALFAFATSTWTVSGRELWEHGGSQLLIATGMLALLKRRWMLSGLVFGATVLFRPHLGIAAALICLGILWVERRWRPAVAFAAAVVPGVVAFLGWNWLVYGHFTITGGYDNVAAGGVGVLTFLEDIAGTLVSPERGVLICSPFLLVAVIGLRAAWRSSPALVRVAAIAGVGYLMPQLWLMHLGGDGFVGYRVCLESLTLAAPLLLRAGVAGVERVGTGVFWALTAISVSFFATGAFVQGETNALNVNPWIHWGPIQLAVQYGVKPVVLGAVIGLSAVGVVWALVQRRQSQSTPVADLGAGLAPGLGKLAPAQDFAPA